MNYRLSEDEIQKLKKLHKSLKIKHEADKIKCIVLWRKGRKWTDIKEALLISEHAISDIINKYKKDGIEGLLKNNFIQNAKMACEYVLKYFMKLIK